jgi:hypothetical protein
MRLIKYQGVVFTGGSVGDSIVWEGLTWTVTEQGHLIADVASDNQTALDLIEAGVVSIQGD